MAKKTERITPQEFFKKVKETSDSRLERELSMDTSNMEILLGEGDAEANKQKVLDYFRRSSDWEDYKQHWVGKSQEAETPEEREFARLKTQNEHFKKREDYMGVSVSIIPASRKIMGKEGEYNLDIHFYDTENNPGNESDKKRRVIADTFCELMQFAEANNMPYVVKNAQVVYTGERGYLVRSKQEAEDKE